MNNNQLTLFVAKTEMLPKKIVGVEVTINLRLTFDNKGTGKIEQIKTPHTFFTGVDSVEVATAKEVAAFGSGWRDLGNNVVLLKCELINDNLTND
jgi:hypothetical protein